VWGDEIFYSLCVELDRLLSLDEGVPRPAYEDVLPDLSADITHTAVWHDKHGPLAVKFTGPKVALMKVFSKIMPENGQPRELNRFVARAFSMWPPARELFHAVALCGLLGNYRHCVYRLPIAARRRVIREFTVEAFAATLEGGEYGNLMMFYVLREYLYAVGRHCPALRAILAAFFQWDAQCDRVCEMMREVRLGAPPPYPRACGELREPFLPFSAQARCSYLCLLRFVSVLPRAVAIGEKLFLLESSATHSRSTTGGCPRSPGHRGAQLSFRASRTSSSASSALDAWALARVPHLITNFPP
jgi:hypothetical protein